jgi:hypothetical protein
VSGARLFESAHIKQLRTRQEKLQRQSVIIELQAKEWTKSLAGSSKHETID